MSKKKKQSDPKSSSKVHPAAAAPLLEEKKTLLVRAGIFVNKFIPGPIPNPLKKHFAGFGKIALFTVPGVFVLSGALVGTDMLLHAHIMPRTSIGNTPIGFMYVEDAAKILEQSAETYLKTPLIVSVNGVEAQVTPEELGIQFFHTQSLRVLPSYDIRKDSMVNLAITALFEKDVEPFMTLDSEKAQNVIEQKLDLKKFRAQDAHITLDNKNPAILAEAPGKVLNKDELISGLKQSIKTMGPININLELMDEQPAITAQELEPHKQLMADSLKSKITLFHEGRQWKFDPSKHADAVTFTQTPTITLKNIQWTLPIVLGEHAADVAETAHASDNIALNTNPSIALNSEKMKDYLQNEIVSKIERPTSDVKIFTDEKKKITIEGKGQNGIKVSTEGLVASLDLALSSKTNHLKIPAAEEKANVTVSEDLQNLGIKNLIATGHSAFAGSHKGRIKNINVGISKYNGLLVEQGATFSFNDNLGEVDAANGFVPELVIKAEGTIPEYGGGLCQVSSTLYRAALFAGFPIVERKPHSYVVSYYAQVMGNGMDATIYPGVTDFKFINDSPGAIVIQAYTEGDQAYYKFYGTDDGRKVSLEGPYQGNYRSPGAAKIVETTKLPPGARKQVEINHTGFDVTWYRYIVKDNQETKETLFSRYNAIPAKIMVGAGAAPTAAVPTT